ncbi:MAG TPA: helicase-related protein [Symbiobacteriaceae bacterium]|nr:helicase-related protein [Symbiobacteriaceae bacterium]
MWHLPRWQSQAGGRWHFDGKALTNPPPEYVSRLDRLTVEWPEVLTCPECSEAPPLTAPARAFIDGDSANKCRPVRFQCSCGISVALTLSKQQHLRVRPGLLVTNVESLDKLLVDPLYRKEGFFSSIDGIAMDELHVYYQLYGTHVHHLLRRLERHHGGPLTLIGASATIPSPSDFGSRLFGRPVKHLVQANDPMFTQETLSAEYFLFLRVPDNDQVAALSTAIQTIMAVGHAVLPSAPTNHCGHQIMVFSDSLDIIQRLELQVKDAEQTTRLYRFRTDDRIAGEFPCVGLDWTRCPALPDGSLCPTYRKGECWRLFWDGSTHRSDPLSIVSISAQQQNAGMQEARNSDVIIASPALEVGVDIPGVGATVHYKTPRAVFSFIQRKGRAGRRPTQFPMTISVLAGSDPMDAFHFKQFDRLVKGQYRLPLNPDNAFIESIHNDYIDATFVGPVMKAYTQLCQSNSYIERFPRKGMEPAGWSVVRESATCPRWTQDMQFALPPEISRGGGMDYVKDYVRSQIKRKQARIEELVRRFGQPVSDRSLLTASVEQALGDLSARIAVSLMDGVQFQPVWQETVTRVTAINSQVTQAPSLTATRDQIMREISGLMNALQQVTQWLFMESENTAAARDSVLALMGRVNELVNSIGNQGFVAAAEEASDLRYQTAALERMQEALSYTLAGEIVKRYQQAQFYLCWSCPRWKCCDLPQKMEHYVPETFFDAPSNLMVSVDGGQPKVEANFMLYSTYVPFKLFYRFGAVPLTVVARGFLAGHDSRGVPQVVVELEGVESIPDFFHGHQYSLPRRIQVRTMEPVSTQTGNRYAFCTRCFNLSSGAGRTCACGAPLREASLFSTPVVKRRYHVRHKIASLNRLIHCQIDGLTEVMGADVTYKIGQVEQAFNARYSQPLGYRYESRGLVLSLSDILDEAWNAYLNPSQARDTVIAEAAQEVLRRWSPPTPPTRDSFTDGLLHTMAHILVRLVCSVCGVNEESLEYTWDADREEVAVWEKYAGGAGISDLFMDYLREAAADVYLALLRIVLCPACHAEARDGCPDDVWLAYCQHGRQEQPNSVSQSLGILLLGCLTERLGPLGAIQRSVLLEQDKRLLVEFAEDGRHVTILNL